MSDGRTDNDNRPKVLVVDDLYANRVVMRHALARLDVHIVDAASGNSALAACLEHEFALILLDVQMPGMDGVEVAQILYGEESMRDTPVIFVTAGSADDMDRLKGYDVGAVDYIVKPLNERLLSAKVRNFLDLYNNRRQLKEALAELDKRNAQLRSEIEERRRAEARAHELATHDPLTHLPNRLLFLDRLDSAMQRANGSARPFALGYMDLDGFKQINDNHGHRAGDTVLTCVAERLQEVTNAVDTVARLGGDEFALIFEGFEDTGACLAICESLRDRLGQPMRVQGAAGDVDVQIGVSLGVAFYPDHGHNADALMNAADCALYAVKYNGKAGVRLFHADEIDIRRNSRLHVRG